MQSRLLTIAIVSALAASAPAFAGNALHSSAVVRAKALIDGPAAKVVRRASADAFRASDADIDAKGTEHVRFQRTYRGLPVIGGDFVLHSRNGKVVGVSQTLTTTARPGLVPSIDANHAIVEAGTRFGAGFKGAPKAHLVVYALGAKPVLAYEVVFSGIKRDQTPTDMHYFVDATSGRVLKQWDTVETAIPGPDGSCISSVTQQTRNVAATAAVGSGKTLTEGAVALNTTNCGGHYELIDQTRGNGYTTNMAMRTAGMGSTYKDADNKWGTGTLTSSKTVAADAHYGVAMTWDYYLDVHGRHGIADNGQGALSRVHYGRNYFNAFWFDGCFCMTFGDGDNGVTANPLIALDVAGHEMSHGVTSNTANLNYEGESGGLNEANSDIMGTMVEFYANNAKDPGDYMIGEKIFTHNDGTKALRYMFKPSLDGGSRDCYSSDIGDLDVHYSSGVANHFYYLLVAGATVPSGFGAGTWANLKVADLVCNGNTSLVKIGRKAAQQIWYRAMTHYMTSNTDYAGARAATLDAATELYGFGSAKYAAVAAAWDAVGVAAPAPTLR
ncbi:M4 family metallopeptidase [Cognatiluteimonas telluris]|uniref:M4 family metallopeptidase n=1 Tax=Cognatiluteimonas telluris TaxID=1104775 RepID=UPI00140DB761|nr:M4 family metallopeptidase [Lysobacter telluris]